MTQLPVNKEEFYNEGACAILDLTAKPFSTKAFLEARNTFERLCFDEQIAVVAIAYKSSQCLDPTTGKMVCFCCGKPFFETHGRRFQLH